MKRIKLIFILALLVLSIFVVSESALSSPIFCNDYEFSCCDLSSVGTSTQTNIGTPESYSFRCNVEECVVSSVWGSSAGYRIGTNCGVKSSWYTSDYYDCANSRGVFRSSGEKMVRGEELYKNPEVAKYDYVTPTPDLNFNIEWFADRIQFCGDSACSASNTGVPIQGSNGCTFIPDGNIYSTGGSYVTTASYTVPRKSCVMAWQSGNRFVCGDTTEECSRDSDCVGHTYGNQECSGRTLQTYGCVSFGNKPTQNQLDVLPFEERPTLSYGNRCDITNSKQVTCCGDNDCGTSAFCDKNTWTCKSTAECSQDSDCGVSEVCDRNSKEMKKPVCSSGQCDYKVLENVDCCLNEDCPLNEFCRDDYTCGEKAVTKTDCPFACCDDEIYYFDKPCTENTPICCGEHVCAENENKCEVPSGVSDKVTCELAGGKWVEVVTEPPFYKFWQGDKISSYCRIPHTPLLGIILLVLGVLGAVVSFFFGLIPFTYLSGVLALISLIWIILANAGVI